MNTPLHIAIQNGNMDIINILLSDGCDLSARNADGQTPLDLATAMNNEQIVRLLLEHGAGRAVPPPNTSPSQPAGVMLDAPQRVLPSG
ncbi:MAG: ankyrin repeat domain-containing protein [Planctomycetaceae bacterium]|nr:ankyrin repeat domain-containing protein [Planctomycetaceae bacterium]